MNTVRGISFLSNSGNQVKEKQLKVQKLYNVLSSFLNFAFNVEHSGLVLKSTQTITLNFIGWNIKIYGLLSVYTIIVIIYLGYLFVD